MCYVFSNLCYVFSNMCYHVAVFYTCAVFPTQHLEYVIAEMCARARARCRPTAGGPLAGLPPSAPLRAFAQGGEVGPPTPASPGRPRLPATTGLAQSRHRARG